MNELNLEKMIPIWYHLDEYKGVKCNMARYTNGSMIAREPRYICGTVMCGLGVCPLHVPIEEGDFRDDDFFSYLIYGERIFRMPYSSREWDWLFSYDWRETDNTFKGVALRAKHLLDHGLPADSIDQMEGNTPYLFENNRTI